MLYGDGLHDETLAIQEMLDGCGIIQIERPGTYVIGKTLIIHSNTRLVLAPGVKLLAAPMSRCSLIENEHFAGGGRDENIEIVGGIWDGNCDEMGLDAEHMANHRLDLPYDPKRFTGKLIRFAHIDRLTLQRMTVRDPVSYGVQIAAANGFVVRDFFFDYNWHFGTADGVHINGPSRDGVIENMCGTTNDDMVALTTYDEPHAEISLGDIENIYIHNVTAKNGYSAIRLLSGENCELRSIHVDGVYGDYRHSGIIISNHNKRPGRVWFEDLTIEHVRARKSYTPLGEGCFRMWEKGADRCAIVEFGKGARCGNVTLRDIGRHEKQSTRAPLIEIGEGITIDRLYAENIYQTTADGVIAPLWDNKGTVKELIEVGVQHE